MKTFAFFTTLVALATASGLNDHARMVKRQASTSTSSSSSSATSSSGSSGSGSSTTTSHSTATTLAGTSIPPLSEITSGAITASTVALTTTASAGERPTHISDAPAIPTFAFNSANWPPLDRTPDISSAEVQEWLTELDGFDIPDLSTTDGTCGGSPQQAADAANRGWWTCGGHTRTTDVVACPEKLTWGMSFDDGPGRYTPKLLEYLDQKDLLATFFVVGSRVIQFPDTLRDEYIKGHEISVHTWSHSYLTSLTNAQIVAELGWTRKAIQSVLGITPTTMRPPYGDIDDRVRAISLAMGMVPIIWTRGPQNNQFDTNDWKIPGGTVTGNQSVDAFKQILGNVTQIETGFIVLEHDLYQQTVDIAVGYTLDLALAFQPPLKLEPIGTCQGWPSSNLYLETTTNTTFPYPESDISGSVNQTNSARAPFVTAAAQGSSSSSIANSRFTFESATSSGSLWLGALSVLAGAFLMV